MRYIANTDADRQAMLDAIGRSSLDELFSDIPQTVADRFRPIGIPPQSEFDVVRTLSAIASDNPAAKMVPFLGEGIYDHYTPSIVSHITGRSEFYTAYTPYQPEISQGTLTTMFEYQTLVCELVGMEVANASMYDGATALAEAALMADRIRKTGRIAVARSLHPHLRRTLDTYCWAAGIERIELPFDSAGRYDSSNVPQDVSAVILQTPNTFGVLETLEGLKERIGEALLIVSTYPIALGILEPPGSYGADIVVAEGQSLGLPMAFGGPLLGLFATRPEYLRQMPGRVAGRTLDEDGNIGYVMASQTREQHIRRQRATSNICTNSALCALAATVYLATLGADGLRQIAELNLEKAHYLADRLTGLDGVDLLFDAPFFNEFILRVSEDPGTLCARAKAAGFLVSPLRGFDELGDTHAVRIAVTEKRSKEELDALTDVVGGRA